MAKANYRCSECGWTSLRWVGQCGECQTWGSVAESSAPARNVTVTRPTSGAVVISEVDQAATERELTGIGELDRVLGGGLVPGAAILLAGEPGVGKSTLLLEVAARWSRAGRKTLYVSGEESATQVRLRADRTGATDSGLLLAAETDLGTVLGHIESESPSLLVVDSVQTIASTSADGAPGGVTQVREVADALVRVAKRNGMAVVIVGHVTKDGAVAGPRLLEHLVDVVLSFEGDRHSGFRMVRTVKNRFGPADEVGCFEMSDTGIAEVADPSGIFVTQSAEPVAGTAITVTMEGRRPLLAEVQALVAPAAYPQSVKRTTHGLESSRLAMVLAVLSRRARLDISGMDVYASTVGGARVHEPAADLAMAAAVASAALDRQYPKALLAIGEIGLAGDLRRVPGLARRLAEAARLGFTTALVPPGTEKLPSGIKAIEVATVAEALAVLDLRRRSG